MSDQQIIARTRMYEANIKVLKEESAKLTRESSKSLHNNRTNVPSDKNEYSEGQEEYEVALFGCYSARSIRTRGR